MLHGRARRSDPFWLLLGLIALVGAVVRVIAAATEPPHFDESYTAVHYVLGSVGHLLTTYDEPNNHVFHSLLAWVSTSVLGDGPFALRLPALLAGAALVPAVGWVARAVVGGARPRDASVAGLVAAAIVAAAPPLIAYSANARGYSVAMLLMVAQFALTLRLGRGSASGPATPPDLGADPRAGSVARASLLPWRLWVVCGALAIWTVPTAVLGVLIAAIWLAALRAPAWRSLIPVAAAVAATAMVSLALYAPVFGQRGFTVDRFSAAPVGQLATTLAHAWTAGLAVPLIAVAVMLAVVGLARRPTLGRNATLAFGLIAVPLVIAVLGRVLPYSRTYLLLLPVLSILAGVGAARITPWVAARGRAVAGTAAAAFAAVALIAGAGAQTREAWGEDPPGPSRDDTVAAMRAYLGDDAPALPGPGEDYDDVFPVGTYFQNAAGVPAYDLPQVSYAFAGLKGYGNLRDVLVSRQEPNAITIGLLITRAEVPPAQALAAIGIPPTQAVAGRRVVRGDAQVVELEPPG